MQVPVVCDVVIILAEVGDICLLLVKYYNREAEKCKWDARYVRRYTKKSSTYTCAEL